MKNIISLSISIVACLTMLCVSCSKSEPPIPLAPTITLGEQSLIYQVKIGKSLTIAPIVENAGAEAKYTWKIDDAIVGNKPNYTHQATDEPAILYVKFEVTTAYGSADKEFCIEVVPYLTPQITMGVPEAGYSIITQSELPFKPEITNAQNATFKWEINGSQAAVTKDFTFSSAEAGAYNLCLTATNEDGSDKLEFTVNVFTPDQLPLTAMFEQTTYNVSLGRTIFIRPYWIKNAFGATYKWSVDGKAVISNTTPIRGSTTASIAASDVAECLFAYTPQKQGRNTVTLTMTNKYATVTTNFTVNVCPAEGTYRRSASGNIACDKVYQFTAAPGQFINEGYTAQTMDQANSYATGRLGINAHVSLGGWGGYLVVGFDHSITNDGGYNIQIQGNAFAGSSEPGITWVMQDENGNGIPDDIWYELKGSDYNQSIRDYAVTYYKPSGAQRPVAWVDNQGKSGQVDYLVFHQQDYYYPNWAPEESYTLVGSRLEPKTFEASPGYWVNGEYEWGYADNFSPIDRLTDEENQNAGVMGNHMKISDAVRHDGSPANLQYIDFIKIQTAVNAKAGWLGENSTEIFGVQDYNLIKKR